MWVLQFTFTEFEWLNEKDIDRAFVSYPIFSKSQSEECNIKKTKGFRSSFSPFQSHFLTSGLILIINATNLAWFKSNN